MCHAAAVRHCAVLHAPLANAHTSCIVCSADPADHPSHADLTQVGVSLSGAGVTRYRLSHIARALTAAVQCWGIRLLAAALA